MILLPTGAAQVMGIQDSSAVLHCIATGDPEPRIIWTLNSILLPNQDTPRIGQDSNNSLIFSPVQTGDDGVYVCLASNVAGNDSASVQLIVYGKEVVMAAWLEPPT